MFLNYKLYIFFIAHEPEVFKLDIRLNKLDSLEKKVSDIDSDMKKKCGILYMTISKVLIKK